jgi:hypothetical protein
MEAADAGQETEALTMLLEQARRNALPPPQGDARKRLRPV